MAATALAQPTVADSLAATFREGITITPLTYHTLQVCGSRIIRYKQCYHTPYCHTPLDVRKCYGTPWFITPPSWPLQAALYHPSCIRYRTTRGTPLVVIICLKPKGFITGVWFLIYCTVLRNLPMPWVQHNMFLRSQHEDLNTTIIMLRRRSFAQPDQGLMQKIPRQQNFHTKR